MKNLMLVVLVLISAVTFAQKGRGHHDPKERATKRADHMKKELSLNDDQYAKVKSLNEKYSERYAAVKKDTSLTRGRTMSRMKSIRSEQETELKKILTPDQATKWDALKAKRHEDRKNHYKHRHGRPDRDQGNG
jgi:Spy/CpxP family protein refolding chaperone